YSFFFFQAEDGIRDRNVTGVQTCALPIYNMKNSALIIVDYSNDFVADNGKLTCGLPGQQIENYIIERIEAYNNKQANIFFLMDLHYEENTYHPENKLFPPHNII